MIRPVLHVQVMHTGAQYIRDGRQFICPPTLTSAYRGADRGRGTPDAIRAHIHNPLIGNGIYTQPFMFALLIVFGPGPDAPLLFSLPYCLVEPALRDTVRHIALSSGLVLTIPGPLFPPSIVP